MLAARKAARHNGILNPEGLALLTAEQLLGTRNVGQTTLREIREFLAARGLAETLATVHESGRPSIVPGTPVPLAATSTITVTHNTSATAQQLAALLRLDPSSIQTTPDSTAPYDIVVNLGRNYNACQK